MLNLNNAAMHELAMAPCINAADNFARPDPSDIQSSLSPEAIFLAKVSALNGIQVDNLDTDGVVRAKLALWSASGQDTGKLIVISGAPHSGKRTLLRRLLSSISELACDSKSESGPAIVEMAGAPLTMAGAYVLDAIAPQATRSKSQRLAQQVTMTRAFEILEGRKTKIVAIERAERLLHGKTVAEKIELADRMERLLGGSISLILCGSDEVSDFVRTHDNLLSRATDMRIEPMANSELSAFVNAYVAKLGFGYSVDFAEGSLPDEIKCMTGGHRGLTARLLGEAAMLAYADDADHLNPSYLYDAFSGWVKRA
jgi:hypothetical protein